MTSVKLLTLEGKKKGTVTLPPIFETVLRRDVIKRAVIAQQSAGYQRHGVDPMAGKRTTAESWGVGHGRARVPRRKGQGYRSASHGAFAPFTVTALALKSMSRLPWPVYVPRASSIVLVSHARSIASWMVG